MSPQPVGLCALNARADFWSQSGPDENYKCLGILEADNMMHTKIKKQTERRYIKRLRKILKSKLNGRNTIKAINTWAVPVIRYPAGKDSDVRKM